MSKTLTLVKENPLMSLTIMSIMLLITAIFYFMWNKKTLVEKLAAEEGIKLRITNVKKLKGVAPSFTKVPVDYCYSWLDYFFPDEKLIKMEPVRGSNHSSKAEDSCREIVERLFNKQFPSVRPNWLKNPMTNRNLELDMYNEELKLAFEYDGQQHREYTPRWHNSQDDFDDQVLRDKMKNKLCRLKGVSLIRVTDNCGDMEKFIKRECIAKGLLES
jgi:hypothetical protein